MPLIWTTKAGNTPESRQGVYWARMKDGLWVNGKRMVNANANPALLYVIHLGHKIETFLLNEAEVDRLAKSHPVAVYRERVREH